MKCPIFDVKRACFIGSMNSIIPGLKNLATEDQLKTIMCPTRAAACKVTNQFLRIMFLARDKLTDGVSISELSYPTMPVNVDLNASFENIMDDADEWDEFQTECDQDTSFQVP